MTDVDQIMKVVEQRLQTIIDDRSKLLASQIVGDALSLKAIEFSFGRRCTWRGVPVTPDQFEALCTAYGVAFSSNDWKAA